MNYTLEKLYKRDLNALLEEVKRFSDEENLWRVPPGVHNSAGNLTLHICGELKHYIGSVIGKINYSRDKDVEFSTKNLSFSEVTDDVEHTIRVVSAVLQGLSNYDLKKTYPISLWNETFSVEFFFIHLLSHLNYHRGQISYVRRILESENSYSPGLSADVST